MQAQITTNLAKTFLKYVVSSLRK